MARQAGPSARSRRLTMVLTQLRVAAGLTRADLAKAVGMSPSKITRIESMESGIYERDLQLLLDFYQVTGERRGELLELVRHAQERGWLRTYSNDAFPEDWQAWIDFEADATGVFNYEPSMIPGLLQTPEYAKAIIQATTSGLSAFDIDRLVASRMARQVRLSHAHPLKLHAIIEEGALMRPFGDAHARVRQLLHLASFAAHPNVQIQILPIEAGLHRALYGPFAILEFGDNTRLIHLEAATSGTFLDEEDQIKFYKQTWDELRELAYNTEKSTKLISVIVAQAHEKN
jgi:transcriptional regulator with XRE-family HTH domain